MITFFQSLRTVIFREKTGFVLPRKKVISQGEELRGRKSLTR